MTEYIDLDTPLELYVEHGGFYEKRISTLRDLLDTNRIPYKTADVRPVMRGEWIDEHPDKPNDPRMRCSVCTCVEAPLVKWRFCPNCGADMRGES